MFNKVFHAAFVVVLLVSTLVIGANTPTYAQGACPSEAEYDATRAQFLQTLNAARAKAGAGPLVYDALLNKAATLHSQDMATKQYFDHTGQDGSSFSDRTTRVGFKEFAMGENIAINSRPSGAQVFDQWWNSPGHKRNMMNPEANIMGLGMGCGKFKGFDNYIYYTQILGQGKAIAPTAAPTAVPAVPTAAPTTAPANPTAAPANPTAAPEATEEGGSGEGDEVYEDAGAGTEPPALNLGSAPANSPISLGDGKLMIRLPRGWTAEDKIGAENRVNLANALKTITGVLELRSADKTGIPAGGDVFAAVTQWAQALGTVVTPTQPIAVTDDYQVAGALVQTQSGATYVFAVLNLKSGTLLYGELTAASVDILKSVNVAAFISAIAIE